MRRHGTTADPGDKPDGNQERDLTNNDPPITCDVATESTTVATNGTAKESDNVSNSEPERDSTDGVLLQQPGAAGVESEVNTELAGVTATENAQKKRSAGLKKKLPSSKKKITANQGKL